MPQGPQPTLLPHSQGHSPEETARAGLFGRTFLFNERRREAIAVARARLPSVLFSFFLMSSRRQGEDEEEEEGVQKQALFPRVPVPLGVRGGCQTGLEVPLRQKFRDILSEKLICEYGRKQKLNSISMCYMFHVRCALPALFYSIWHWEGRLKDL